MKQDVIIVPIITLIISIGLIVYGLYALLHPQKLIDMTMRMTGEDKATQKGRPGRFSRLIRKKWFVFNMRFCGFLCILSGLFILVLTVSQILKIMKSG